MPADALSRVFSALADPTRRDMVARLAVADATVNELAEPYDVSLQAVSKHLKVLEGAGLVVRRTEGRTTICTLRAAPLADASAWVRHYERFWDDALDRLQALVEEAE